MSPWHYLGYASVLSGRRDPAQGIVSETGRAYANLMLMNA